MQSEQQYEQLMLQYMQLKNGALDIANMIENEDFDNAITMLKRREKLFLNCKCMRRYLDLTDSQKKELDSLLNEIKAIELENINKLEKGISEVQSELKKTQQNQKFKHAYNSNSTSNGSLVNYEE